jgi:hypothetical protein
LPSRYNALYDNTLRKKRESVMAKTEKKHSGEGGKGQAAYAA